MKNEVLQLLGVAGEVVRIAPDKAEAINQVVGKAIVNTTMSDGQKLLAAKIEKLNADAREKFASGQLEFTDLVKYIRRDVSLQGGNFDVFEESVDKETGVSNFSKARLAPGENIMLERIEVMYDRGTGITTKTADLAPVINTDDNALFNGEIEVKANGKLLVSIPVCSLNQPPKGMQGLAANCNGFNLKAPKLIKENEDIQITVKFAGTMASSSDKDIIEVKLIGDGIRIRS